MAVSLFLKDPTMFRAVCPLRFAVAIAVCLGAATLFAGEPEKLFDGSSLEGWEGNEKLFRIEEEAIVAGTMEKEIEHNEFLCTTREFEDFELKLKFKVKGKGANAGVQLRSKRIPDHHEVKGYQADLGDGWWGCLYDESRRNRVLARADAESLDKVLKRDDWNEYVIRCEGPRIRLWINGHLTVDYTEEEAGIDRKGLIGLQIHGGPPSEAWYKDITIEEL
jgi:hypothetical protein